MTHNKYNLYLLSHVLFRIFELYNKIKRINPRYNYAKSI